MYQTFYEYIVRHVNYDANDPISRLANQVHQDIAFPKRSQNFEEISSYLETSPEYTKLISIFDEAWQSYQFNG